MSEPVLQVFVFRDGAYIGSEVFSEPELVVGNGEGSDLKVNDAEVGDAHAIVAREGGGVTVLDLGHPTGTRVNGRMVQHAEVSARDEVTLGRHMLKMKLVRPRAGAEAAVGGRPKESSRKAPTADLLMPEVTPAPNEQPEVRASVPGPGRGTIEDLEPAIAEDPVGAEEVGSSDVIDVASLPSGLLDPAPEERLDSQSRAFGTLDEALADAFGPGPGESQLSPDHQFSSARTGGSAAAIADGLAGSLPVMDEDRLDEEEVATVAAPFAHLADGEGPPLPTSLESSFAGESTAATPMFRAESPALELEEALDASPSAEVLMEPSLPPMPPADLSPSRISRPYLPAASQPPEPADLHESDAETAEAAPQAPAALPATARGLPLSAPPAAVPPPPPSSSEAPWKTTAPPQRSSEAQVPWKALPSAGSSDAQVPQKVVTPAQNTSEAPAPWKAMPVDAPMHSEVPEAPPEFGARSELVSPALPPEPPPLESTDDELDPEEQEENEAPGFSLLEELVRGGQPRGGSAALEVIVSEEGQVRAVELMRQGRAKLDVTEPQGSKLRLVRLLAGPVAEIRFPSRAAGVVIDGGKQVPLDHLKVPSNAVSQDGDHYAIRIGPGQSLTLRLGETGYHLRFVTPPPVPSAPAPGKRAMQEPLPRALGSSVALHFLIAIIVGLTIPAVSFSDERREVWAEIEPDEVRTVEVLPPAPEPEPAPVPPPRPEPKPVVPRERPPKVPKSPQAKTRKPPKVRPQADVKKAGVLGALGKLGPAAIGKKNLVAAVSNVDAVKAPGASGYRVGTLIGKAPTSDVRLGGRGGGKPLTRGSANLLRGGDGFATIGKKSSGVVRGQVAKPVERRIEAKGQLGRAEILKVINANFGQVQSCYERTLILQPDLRGKISIEWTIGRDGRVSKVRQKFATMKSPAVSKCLLKKIRQWRFPKPRGGIVIVSYPFVFRDGSY